MDDYLKRYIKKMKEASNADKGTIITAHFNWLAPGVITAGNKYEIGDVLPFYLGGELNSVYFLIKDDEGKEVGFPFIAFKEFSVLEI
jgi:hypothetical protein